MILSGLHLYPMKSARGQSLTEVMAQPEGLAGDRCFMLADPAGKAITQRELRPLAQTGAEVAEGRLTLRLGPRSVAVSFDPARRMGVTVWGNPVDAALAPEAINDTLSDWYGTPVRLVAMDALARRDATAEWAGPGVPTSLADDFPLLVTTTASLADLNRSMAGIGQESVAMDRFRPNLVIDQPEPWAEDLWQTIRIGNVVLDLVKPCARCVMTTQDQMTGERTGGDPLRGLFHKRLSRDPRVTGPLFGWNAVPRVPGMLRVGMEVSVLSPRADRWPMRERDTRR